MELEEYDRIVSALYDAALDSSRWAEALEMFRDLFQANFVTLILRSPDESNLGMMIAVGLEGGDRVTYLPYGHTATPFVNQLPDTVFTVDDLMTEAEWRRMPYYLHWCAPLDVFHVMGADILTAGAGKLRFRLTRSETAPKFSALDRARCEALLPHLRRALHLHNLFDRSEALGALYSGAIGRLSVGMVLLDESGKVLEQNLIARELLAANDGLKLVGGRLEASYPSDNRELQQLIRSAFPRHFGAPTTGASAISVSDRPLASVQATGIALRTAPPNSCATGTPRRRPRPSHSAISTAQRAMGLARTVCSMIEIAPLMSLPSWPVSAGPI